MSLQVGDIICLDNIYVGVIYADTNGELTVQCLRNWSKKWYDTFEFGWIGKPYNQTVDKFEHAKITDGPVFEEAIRRLAVMALRGDN